MPKQKSEDLPPRALGEQRLMELEIRYMKLERLVEELSGVVATQQRTLDRVTAELRSALARLRDLGERTDGAIPDEKPPHY